MKRLIANGRKSDFPIQELILNRWSPRAMSDEPVSDEELHSLFEAARWAPSCYNDQPWRFLYAKKGTAHWDLFFDLLVEFNQSWCHSASFLGLSCARKTFEKNNTPSQTFAYDTGAAWENMCLEGASRGIVVHGMGGFDYLKAKSVLNIPDDYEVLAMFAVGKWAPKEKLSPPLQNREAPGARKKISEFAFEGAFPNG